MNPPSPAPPSPDDPAPIATAEQFCDALLRVRDREGITPTDLGILRAFYHAPDNALTALKLAKAANLASWQEANLRFGTLARSVGEVLHFTPSTRPDGTLRWWQSLAHGAADYEDETGHFPWTLRPELVRALQTMKWV